MSLLQTFTGAGVGGAITAAYRSGYQTWEKVRANFVTLNDQFLTGTGSPEGVVTATVSRLYFQTDGAYGTTLWTKASGSGNTGWKTATPILSTSVVLTDAQIKALPTTPIELIPAQASGYRAKILGGSVFLHNSPGAYTNINTSYAALQLDYPTGEWAIAGLVNDDEYVAGGGFLIDRVTSFFNTNNECVLDLLPDVSSFADGTRGGNSIWTNIPNVHYGAFLSAALRVSFDNNGSGNLTGGNATNYMRVTVYWAKEQMG